ncbi:MAG: lipoyl(octanoyl) transferase [Solirubrobacteraceae bacterium]|nr:lipoyl(octanoyl) transferase [Solirubrobacteraceae bacterium]
MTASELWVCQLGTVEYREALALQERVRAARQDDRVPDVLLVLEHPPVYTRGRRSQAAELPMGEAWYLAQGIDVVDVDRGGRVTYHGPGQLVGYPIMRIADVIAYLRTMERAIVATLADAGVPARARPDDGPDFTGVWAGERKIASIGVHVARGVTTHGFAINVQNDLQPFSWVVPCGLDGVQMTSVIKETGASGTALPLAEIRVAAARRFAQEFGHDARAVDLAGLEAAIAEAAAQAARPGAGP